MFTNVKRESDRIMHITYSCKQLSERVTYFVRQVDSYVKTIFYTYIRTYIRSIPYITTAFLGKENRHFRRRTCLSIDLQ